MSLYDVPTDGCNLEIMGYSFFAEEVSPTEAFRRRELNYNSIVGGTKKVTNGEYVGLEFSVTTHVKVDPKTPNMHNKIFEEMMGKPVQVVSPDMGGTFNASVIIKPERESPRYLKLTITIKEIPDRESRIPGEQFLIPKTKKIKIKKTGKNDSKNDDSKKNDTKNNNTKKNNNKQDTKKNTNKKVDMTKRNVITKKVKSAEKILNKTIKR